MLSREDNELLTRVGPGTGMGELMRRCWMPVLLSAEIAEPDCTPVRIRLLGEALLAFRDTAGRVGVVDMPWGMTLGARRVTDEGRYYWRMNQWYFPFYTMIAPVPGEARSFRMWVPSDDTHTSILCISYREDRPVSEREADAWRRGENSHAARIPGTLRPARNAANDYLIDREKQRTESFSGIDGIRAQDAAMVESAGPIADRTREHLGTSDTAVIRMRRLLLAAAKAPAAGVEPGAAAGGSLYRVRSHSTVIAETGDFDQYPDIMQAMGIAPAPPAAAAE
jgi:phthalate 4,5-dioxygenase oxygenase subunit